MEIKSKTCVDMSKFFHKDILVISIIITTLCASFGVFSRLLKNDGFRPDFTYLLTGFLLWVLTCLVMYLGMLYFRLEGGDSK